MAEREGFEPPDPFESTVFKTAAFDHSATSPIYRKPNLNTKPNYVDYAASTATLLRASMHFALRAGVVSLLRSKSFPTILSATLPPLRLSRQEYLNDTRNR